MIKTNVMCLLNQAGISYKAITYDVIEENLSGTYVAE